MEIDLGGGVKIGRPKNGPAIEEVDGPEGEDGSPAAPQLGNTRFNFQHVKEQIS